MGIFFDQDWFDDRLKAAGLTRGSLAQATGMTIDEVEMVFADRRELEGPEVHAIARMLAEDPEEVANRSGAADPGLLASGPVTRSPRNEPSAPAGFVVTREVIAGLHERMDRLERMIELVLHKLDRR
jgi:hypothetical protein